MPVPNSAIAYVVYSVLAVSVGLNVYLLGERAGRVTADETPAPTVEPPPIEPPPIESPVAESPAAESPAAESPAAESPPQIAVQPPTAAPPVAGGEWQIVRAQVEHSIARTFIKALPEHGDPLSAVYARLVVWNLDLTRDLQRGDAVAAVWRPTSDGNYDIAAATLESSKLGETLRAYRFRRPGDSYDSYWTSEGREVPGRLIDGPIEGYEQITALLKDRPTHKGMDFKADVGTPVMAPRAADVTRTNWNWKANGNAIELRFDDGVIAKFLHLSQNRVEAGQRVAAGQVIASSGNTGRSTAPHLHYQLERGPNALDPVDYHGVRHRNLPSESLAEFRAVVARFDALLEGS